MASGIGGKIAVVDTERSSASLYSHLAEFDALDLDPPYTPERFIEAVRAAEKAGYSVLILTASRMSGAVLAGARNLSTTSRAASTRAIRGRHGTTSRHDIARSSMS